MSTMDISKLSNNQLKQMASDKKRVCISYKDMKTKLVHRFAGDFSEPLLRAFSSYCKAMLPDQKKTAVVEVYEKASIIIEAPDKDTLLAILHWISRYAAGDKTIPPLGDTPLFNVLKVDAAAKLMGLPAAMISQLDNAIDKITASCVTLDDIKAIVSTFNEGIKQKMSNMAGQIFNAQVARNITKVQSLIKIISASPTFSSAVRQAVETKEADHMKRLAEIAAQRNANRRPRLGYPTPQANNHTAPVAPTNRAQGSWAKVAVGKTKGKGGGPGGSN